MGSGTTAVSAINSNRFLSDMKLMKNISRQQMKEFKKRAEIEEKNYI